MPAWEPAESAAKNAQGQYVGLIGGQWVPVQGAAKDASGKFMVWRDQVPAGSQSQPKPAAAPPTDDSIFTPKPGYHPPSFNTPEKLAADPAVRFSLGAASPFMGLFQMGANMTPYGPQVNAHMKQLEEMKKAGAAETDQGGAGAAAELGGSIMSAPWLKAAKVLPAAKTFVGRTLQNAGFGAAGGATAPVTGGDSGYWNEKADQTELGAAAGGVLPLAGAVASKVAKTGYHGLIEPWLAPTAIKGRAYLDAAGDKVGQIVDLLTKNKQIVAGAAPTAGEVAVPAGRAEFSALQESAKRAAPSDYVAREDAQNQARLDSLKEWAGNPAKRSAAAAERSARAAPHYEKGVEQTATTNGLEDLAQRPSTGAVLKRAERLMEEKDKNFEPLFPNGLPRKMTGEQAQAVKLAFDDMITAFPKSAMDTKELDAIKATRSEYVKWMEKSFPELGRGRKLYKMESAPINQMDVGEELVSKLTPALREDAKQRGTVFAGAVRDSASTIKKATGEPRFSELKDVLSGRQLESVHNVQEDLARSSRHQDLARAGGGTANALDLATASIEREAGGKPPTLLHRGYMLANAILARAEGKINRKLAAEMAAEMLSPPGVAKSLAEAQARAERNKAVADAIQHWQRPAVAGGVGFGLTQGE